MNLLMNITVLDVLEFLGTYAFAVSGIRLAAGKNFDYFGAYVIGMVTAVGGGTMRDMMLGMSPFWMTNPIYLVESFVAFLTVLSFNKVLVKHNESLFLFDTLGLALFTIVGLEKTLQAGFPWWTAIIMGTFTGAAGGVFRDVLINEVPLIFRKEIYALACVIGGNVFILLNFFGLETSINEIVSGISVLLVRYLAVAHHISLPKLGKEQAEE